MATRRLFLSLVLSTLTAIASFAQAAAPSEATDVTASEIQAIRELIGDRVDLQAKIVDVGGANVGVGVLHRKATTDAGGAVRGLVHHDVAEVYYILEGTGTLITGGATTELQPISAESGVVRELVGPSSFGTSSGGQSRDVGPGDVVVIPAGVFHAFGHIEEGITYLSLRVDPEQVLPAGYVHPALQ